MIELIAIFLGCMIFICCACWSYREESKSLLKQQGECEPLQRIVLDSNYQQAKAMIQSGIEYAQEALAAHDVALGRTTRKNQRYAELIEDDIKAMRKILSEL